jgi:phosphoglycerate kinase
MKQSIASLANQLSGKKVLVRVDYNVPLDATTGAITDNTRIQETLPTLNLLINAGAKIILASHLGRPNGQVVEALRLTPIATELQRLLPAVHITKANAVVGSEVDALVANLHNGDILLLENVRFEAGEEANDPALSKQLAALCDVFVNDAFGTAHRAQASTEGVAHFAPIAVAGLLMAKEIDNMGGILSNPPRPFTAIIGGSKISTKITVLENLLDKVDTLIIGGGMAYTFLLAQGYSVGKSLVEPSFTAMATTIMAKAKTNNVRLILSEDLIVADAFSPTANTQKVLISAIPDSFEGMDIGEKTRKTMSDAILASKAILWNGPVGVFEMAPFAEGTKALADAVIEATQNGAKSVLGGGDTVAAVEKFGMNKALFTHVSTGGGASLEFIEGKTLPGIAILADAPTATACAL